ncbi:MAG: PBSX family phage terminase large subunit [Bacillota bacterium]|jgi:phage terminase large subunit
MTESNKEAVLSSNSLEANGFLVEMSGQTAENPNAVHIKDIIAPAYYEMHHFLRKQVYCEYWFKGGRGSGKSSFISLEIILLMMRNPELNAVAIRKVGLYLRDSVYQQLKWAIDLLQVSHLWKCKESPMEMIYLPTGQKILFRGCDKAEKLKSTKVVKGYIGIVWFEELTEFDGMKEIRSIRQSLLRGGDTEIMLCSYNPPKYADSWVNQEVLRGAEGRHCLHTTYRDMPVEWLGSSFVLSAESLKNSNEKAYRHEYLGEVVGGDGEIFDNVVLKKITDQEISVFDRIRRGIDWGYGKDPFVYVVCYYDRKHNQLYIFDEFYRHSAKFNEIADYIRSENKDNLPVTADSAEPRSNDELRERGIRILAAKKGAGSIEHGISWLQNLNAIIIDKQRTPNVCREFSCYHLISDSNGNYQGGYPDKDNHTIDAVRYAMEQDMRQSAYSFK